MSDEVEEKSEGTSIEIGGVKFTGGKMFAIATALSAGIGTLYGGFEVYKDYMDMKKQIQEYVAPDLSSYDQRIAVLNQRLENAERLSKSNGETIGLVADSMSRGVTSAMRSVDAMDARTRQSDLASSQSARDQMQAARELREELKAFDRENATRIRELEKSTAEKIEKTLANPLANED